MGDVKKQQRGMTSIEPIARSHVIRAAHQEFLLQHAVESDDEKRGRRAAIRGLMIRLGIYKEFLDCAYLDAAERAGVEG